MKRLWAALSSTSRVRSCTVTAMPLRLSPLASRTDCSTIRNVRAGSPKLMRTSLLSFSPLSRVSSGACSSMLISSGSSSARAVPSSLRPSQRNSRRAVGFTSTTWPSASSSSAPSAMVAISDCCFTWAAVSSSMLAAL